jgi:hypothetical protein
MSAVSLMVLECGLKGRGVSWVMVNKVGTMGPAAASPFTELLFNELTRFRGMNEGKRGIYNPAGFRLNRLRDRLQTATRICVWRNKCGRRNIWIA